MQNAGILVGLYHLWCVSVVVFWPISIDVYAFLQQTKSNAQCASFHTIAGVCTACRWTSTVLHWRSWFSTMSFDISIYQTLLRWKNHNSNFRSQDVTADDRSTCYDLDRQRMQFSNPFKWLNYAFNLTSWSFFCIVCGSLPVLLLSLYWCSGASSVLFWDGIIHIVIVILYFKEMQSYHSRMWDRKVIMHGHSQVTPRNL